MPDRADQAVGITRQAGERATEHFVGGTVAVNVGGQEGADAAIVGVAGDLEETFFGKLLAEVHETSTVPGAECRACQVHSLKV